MNVYGTDKETLHHLSTDKQWLKLLTVYNGQTPKVTDEAFLLTAKSEFSSLKELNATLESFTKPVSGDINLHGQCKYPARYIFLKEKLDFKALDIEEVICPEYSQYTDVHKQHQLSLVFATGFLGNPASYYGHLLLNVNQKNKANLDKASINFGADIPANEGMLAYIINGIDGSYNSSFTTQPFFYHFNNYNETEHRDLWEYPIALAPEQSELVLAHLWELINVDFQYFFFNRNCAYFMARAIELVLDEDIIEDSKLWVGPQEVIQKLHLSSSQGQPVLGDVKYHPSRQTRLYQRFASLTDTEKETVRNIALAPDTLSLQTLAHLAPSAKYRIIDTLIDYYQFVRNKEDKQDSNNLYYKKAVVLRYQLPVAAASQSFHSNNTPALGRGISRSYIGFDSLGTVIGIRPSYYDALDASYGHIKHAELKMGEFEVIIDSGNVDLYSVTLLSIESIKQNYTSLPGDENSSWFLTVGAEQETLTCSSCLMPKVELGKGFSYTYLNSSLVLSGFATAGFKSDDLESDGFFAGAKLKGSWLMSDMFSAAATLNHTHYLDDTASTLLKIEQRTAIAQSADLRLSWSHDFENDSNKVSFNVGYYW
ncbi:DUF4105 domain-containing protein [Pseudoalteromonas luteoviolacea]|uniref:Uncharacterized protein n=1 Tax=Pseudoalteromonas luteoviolacea S4054 TaxID=1129367 RepID=A0A0F6A529_9GAMM|nr:DUF4105 domain-containing protein [Pseudoalteromonas luteoviolacea]AOT07667.1 hypothetical protein S4054249_07335 [Pseudoalteromonas luteoviolacea]AOT12583.1 hypothetical protein S40542_07335 [Pseudoalteromonas luteoviolacea]AOT17497.1 hypothetical protein S4054_07335 [Pseudoalteromonas luteoviolacea]KKE81203.1 hypothetical protein N479_23260 [Pseudoalteromonas luteoviolacea S4054]KZN66331.1 hypothetical protein N481_24355 [Pseudoalteromonas luteoviolacea S4047-1]